MSKLLIPLNYIDAGYSGLLTDFQISMNAEQQGFEAYKAFTTDNREYLKVTGNIDLGYEFISDGTQAIFMLSNQFFSSTSNKLYLYKSTSSTYSPLVIKNPNSVYGDGAIYSSYVAPAFVKSGLTKTLVTYPADTSYQYYRIVKTPVDNTNIQILMHGILYDLPDNYRIGEREYSYTYRESVIKTNLVGNIYYDGIQNNSIKKEHSLLYDYASEDDRLLLLDCFKLGKGGLPMLFIDSINNPDTWMVVGIKNMTVTEHTAGYFKIDLSLVEY